jgi:hypothetical protein
MVLLAYGEDRDIDVKLTRELRVDADLGDIGERIVEQGSRRSVPGNLGQWANSVMGGIIEGSS